MTRTLKQLLNNAHVDDVAEYIYNNLTIAEIDLLEISIKKVKCNFTNNENKSNIELGYNNNNYMSSILHKQLALKFIKEEVNDWNDLGYNVTFFPNEDKRTVGVMLDDRHGGSQYFESAKANINDRYDEDFGKAVAIAKAGYNEHYKEVLKKSHLGFLLD